MLTNPPKGGFFVVLKGGDLCMVGNYGEQGEPMDPEVSRALSARLNKQEAMNRWGQAQAAASNDRNPFTGPVRRAYWGVRVVLPFRPW